MKILKLEICLHKENNKYSKTLTLNFNLAGKKNSVVISRHTAHDWIECEFEVMKKMSLMKGYKKMLSQKEELAKKQIEEED